MRVFAQIATESKKKIQDLRMGDLEAMQHARSSPSSSPSLPSSFPSSASSSASALDQSFGTDDESRLESRREAERERDYASDSRQAERDGSMPGYTGAGVGGGGARRDERRESEVGRMAGGAWDRLRMGGQAGKGSVEKMAEHGSGGGNTGLQGRGGDGRTQEQREFDEMLERERKGASEEERWR